MNAREPRPVPYSLISRQAMRRDLPRPISWWIWHAVDRPQARSARAARLLCRVSRGTKYLTPAEACVVARRASWAVAHAEETARARNASGFKACNEALRIALLSETPAPMKIAFRDDLNSFGTPIVFMSQLERHRAAATELANRVRVVEQQRDMWMHRALEAERVLAQVKASAESPNRKVHAQKKEIARLNTALVAEASQTAAAREIVQRVAMLAGSKTRDADAVFAHAEIGRIIHAAGLDGGRRQASGPRHERDWTAAWSADPAQLVRNLADTWARAVKAEKRVEELGENLVTMDSERKHVRRLADRLSVEHDAGRLKLHTCLEMLAAARAMLNEHRRAPACSLSFMPALRELVDRISAVLGA